MNKQDLEQSWARTKKFLNRAAALVPQSDSKNLVQYNEYLDYNELELAMDELLKRGRISLSILLASQTGGSKYGLNRTRKGN
jgi:hypothetical protein